MRGVYSLIILTILLFAYPALALTLGTSASAPSPKNATTTGVFSAATDATSISSVSTEIVHASSGGLGIGSSSPSAPVDVLTNISSTGFRISAYVAGSPNSSFGFRTARGTLASPSAVQLGDSLGEMGYLGYGSTGFASASRTAATFAASENWSDTAQGAYLTFTTTPNNSTVTTEVMRLDPQGRLGIGSTIPTNLLDLASSGGIHLANGLPASTDSALYNLSSTLVWNGSPFLTQFSGGRLYCNDPNCAAGGSHLIKYCPYKGHVKTTAAQGNYTIPSSCLTADLTSMYVGGSASSAVAANTLYYIYLWNIAGTWVLDAETGGHATDSSSGVEIKSGDSSKTLVGMIKTDATGNVFTAGKTTIFGDTNTVATWDNRIPTVTTCRYTIDRASTWSTPPPTYAEVNPENRCYFMSWGDPAQFLSAQVGTSSANNVNMFTFVGLDAGSTSISLNAVSESFAGHARFVGLPANFTPTEGGHFTYIAAQVFSGSTSTYWGNQNSYVFSIQ